MALKVRIRMEFRSRKKLLLNLLHWRGFDRVPLLFYWVFALVTVAILPGVQLTSVPIEDVDLFLQSMAVSNGTTEGYSYESSQRSIKCTAMFPPILPKSITELQDIIHFALMRKYHLKVIGSLHSINDIICTDGLVISLSRINHFWFDPKTNIATAGAGTLAEDLMKKLDARGRSLASTPAYGGITIGGAIGTGAHGSSLRRPATFSDQIVAVTVVDGLGRIRKVTAEEEDFKAFRVHLGLLGIIFEVELQTIPQYKLQIQNIPSPDDILWTGQEIINIAKNNDLFQFWWFPTNKQIVMSFANEVPMNTSGNCETHMVPEVNKVASKGASISLELMQTTGNDVSYFFVQSASKISLFSEVPGRTPVYTRADGHTSCVPKAVGVSYRLLSNRCRSCEWLQGDYSLLLDNPSFSIELGELPAALRTLREVFETHLTLFPIGGMYFRFSKRGESYMGMNGGRDTVNIDWLTVTRYDKTQPKLGITAYQAMSQALVERHGARPHWGKNGLYYSNPQIVRRAFPQLPQFLQVMNRMDPHELFINDLGRRLKYGSHEMTVRKDMAVRCALNEACKCNEDSDCGNGGPLDYVCDELMEFRVCKRRPNPLDDLKDIVSRKVISLAAEMANNIDYVLGALSDYSGFGLTKELSGDEENKILTK